MPSQISALKPVCTFAEADEGQGVDGAQELSVHEVLDAPSTGATKPFAVSVECGGRFLQRSFFTTNPLTASRDLLGCTLYYKNCSGVIIETEAYAELDDPACHTFRRPSARKFLEEHPAGTAYVYLNYGVHWLFNILVKGKNEKSHGFVLVRAIEPGAGLDLMRERRLVKNKKNRIADEELCSGPGKLTQAFAIDGVHHGIDLFNNDDWKLTAREKFFDEAKIIETPRIGISQAKERLWRFVVGI